MNVKTLENYSVGSTLKIKENGVLVDYLIVHRGNPDPEMYDASCDGVWLRRKDIPEKRAYSSDYTTGSGYYYRSLLKSYLDNEFINRYSPSIQALIKTVKIPHITRVGTGTYDKDVAKLDKGLECKLFLLSANELGYTNGDHSGFYPYDGDRLSYYGNNDFDSSKKKRQLKFGDYYLDYFTRSAYTSNCPWIINDEGSTDSALPFPNTELGFVPVMIMPYDARVDADTSEIIGYTVASITASGAIMQGQIIQISWSEIEIPLTYVLERKADTDEDWTQVYSGAETSYEDAAGDWTSVQYRVKAGDGTDFGDYTVSGTVQVLPASTLAISGEDADLGYITTDLRYTVLTDTGKRIALSCEVNGQTIATVEVENGFSATIPVIDLPTGAGSIALQAGIQADSGLVTATRTWKYCKPAVAFPASGGPAQLAQDGKNVFPPTLAECVRVPAVFGGDLGKALELLLPLLGMAAMAVGSYDGTGTFGEDSPNSLTFAFTPQLVIVSGGGQSLTLSGDSITENSVTWHSDSAETQMNRSGVTYTYAAIGKAGA